MRRWLQFGILDLLILTTITAVAVALSRPLPSKAATKAKPWIIGQWSGDDAYLALFPDGVYQYTSLDFGRDIGADWKLSRSAALDGAFVLVCGERRFLIRSQWGSGALELLNADGSVQSSLRLVGSMEGSMAGHLPHGTWTITFPEVRDVHVLEYRNGELIDVHLRGHRNLPSLNEMRAIRRLPALTEHDFPAEDTPKRESDD
jgi:hypothetical protein